MRTAPALLLLTLAAAALAGGCASAPPPDALSPRIATRVTDTALAMVGKPYRYGGNSPAGFDCSGLVQYSYGRAGVRLSHGTDYLRRHSRPIALREAQRGDLLFFNEQGKSSSHVAIYVGDRRFVHAPSSGKHVHVASFTNPYWQRSFAEARRLEID
jgi:cell wall-associated NlpC family hydrolase